VQTNAIAKKKTIGAHDNHYVPEIVSRIELDFSISISGRISKQK